MKILVLLFAALLVAGCGQKKKPLSEFSLPLSDADIKHILEEAVPMDSLPVRNGLSYLVNESEPFSGWGASMYDSGQVEGLARFKDGKGNGPQTLWHESGKKKQECTIKDGELYGLLTEWHENGQKWSEATYKDGEEVSAKYWNSKGEEE